MDDLSLAELSITDYEPTDGHVIQKVVTPEHRMVLAGWLVEVSCILPCWFACISILNFAFLQVAFEWNLESTIVFRAITYLDNFLERRHVDNISR